jgi:hypothetical protein
MSAMTIKQLAEKLLFVVMDDYDLVESDDSKRMVLERMNPLLTDWVRELVGEKERFLTLKHHPYGGLKQSIRDVDRSTENWNRGVRNALRLNILDKAGTSFAKNKYKKQESR